MRKVTFTNDAAGLEGDLLVILGEEPLLSLRPALQSLVEYHLENSEGPEIWITTNGSDPIPKIVLLLEEQEPVALGERLGKRFKKKRIALLAGEREAEKIAFGMMLTASDALEELSFCCNNPSRCEELFRSREAVASAIAHAKALIAAPANLLPPPLFAERCLDLAKAGIAVAIYDAEEVGASALAAAGGGSAHRPLIVTLEWKGGEGAPIALVGKGVCFDSGGINLKQTHLTEMKWDKAGAGAVVGALHALALLNAPINAVGIIGLMENMPGSRAYKPGDLLPTLSGLTVEIVDTDCEGRLLLADCLTFCQERFAPKTIIDLGTLTLEVFGALGGEYAGLFTPDESLARALLAAGDESGEKLWRLPLGSAYARDVASSVADLKNAGIPGYGSSSAAAEFLRAFVAPEIPWAHLDIAGVAWSMPDPSGGVTAFGIRLLVDYMKQCRVELNCDDALSCKPVTKHKEGL